MAIQSLLTIYKKCQGIQLKLFEMNVPYICKDYFDKDLNLFYLLLVEVEQKFAWLEIRRRFFCRIEVGYVWSC